MKILADHDGFGLIWRNADIVRHEKVFLRQQQLLAETSRGNMGKTITDRILISFCGTRTLHI